MTLRMVMKIGLVKRNNSFIWIIIVITLFSACCHSTPSAPPDYGAAYNHVRDNLGIKLIPSDYTPEQNIGNDQGLWIYYANPRFNFDSMSKLPKAYYAGKMLRIINDTLIFESDNYGLFRFPTPSQKIPLAMLFYA